MPTIHVNPDPCIACTTCTVFCPVAQATGEFLGPRMIGPALQRFRLLNMAEDNSLSYCSNCKNCDISCPQGVQVGAINMAARAESLATEHPHFLRDWIVSHSETLGHLISPVPAPLKNYAMRNCLVRRVLDVIGIDKRSTMPSYAPKRFRQLLAAMKQKSGLTKKVAIFPGCYIDLYDPKAGEDLVWALNQAGYEVVSSDKFCCCGVPMVASGFMKDARRNAERNLSVLKEFAEQGIPVLTACPSCEPGTGEGDASSSGRAGIPAPGCAERRAHSPGSGRTEKTAVPCPVSPPGTGYRSSGLYPHAQSGAGYQPCQRRLLRHIRQLRLQEGEARHLHARGRGAL